MHRLQNGRLVGGRVEAAAGFLHRQLPGDVRQHVTQALVVGGPDEVDGNLVVGRLLQDVVERLPLVDRVRVLAVTKDDHQVALRVQEIEGPEQLDAAADGPHDERAVVREPVELLRCADQADAEQDVFVVVGERSDDVRLAAELHQRYQVAMGPFHAPPDEVIGGRDVRQICVAPPELFGGEGAVHAERRVDQDRDPMSGEGCALLDQCRVRVSDRHRHERQSRQEQEERRMADWGQRRPPRDGRLQQRRQHDVGTAGSTPQDVSGQQYGHGEQHDEAQRQHRLVPSGERQARQRETVELGQGLPRLGQQRRQCLHGAHRPPRRTRDHELIAAARSRARARTGAADCQRNRFRPATAVSRAPVRSAVGSSSCRP